MDCQNTFCLPGGELFVAGRSGLGAVKDSWRLCQFLYGRLDRISEIVLTLDTHTAIQVFHAHFFLDQDGNPPAAYTQITSDDLETGRYRVNPEAAAGAGLGERALSRHALHYCRRLESQGKYVLVVWPYHAMLGGAGHAVVPAIEEAVFFHSIARSAQPRFEPKGLNPLTENYSVLRPEVLEDADGNPIAEPNRQLLDHLLEYDALILSPARPRATARLDGVRLRDEIARGSPWVPGVCPPGIPVGGRHLAGPVVVPVAPIFTDAADAAYARFERAGMVRVRSTDPLEEWPGFPA